MKEKRLLEVPDFIFEALGFTLPQKEVKKYFEGDSVTEYLGNRRILSLKREHTYQKSYSMLTGIHLLNLNYLSMPKNISQCLDYVLRVIERDLKRTILSLQEKDHSLKSVLNYIRNILESYGDEIHISLADPAVDASAKVASLVLGLPQHFCFRIEINFMGVQTVYGGIGGKRKHKSGYYCLCSDHSLTAHTTDLLEFLSRIVLLNGIMQIRDSINLPLVQNVYEEYLNEKERDINKIQNVLAESLGKKVPVPFASLISAYRSENEDCFSLTGYCSVLSDAAFIFGRVLEIYQDVKQENLHRTELGRSVATAYITKKNIPFSIQRAMEKSDFMNYFKYVEFDEEVDLASVKAIEEEFKFLNQTYFSGAIFKDVKLRFRKLGKHKASGLYYPTLHTLCVDIRSPSSFIHEYFHMIDDQLGDLSLEVDFNNVVDKYKDAFLNGMERIDDVSKDILNGKSKYNIKYFFRRAKIFARCGEIYFSRILSVESSLIKLELAYAYPESVKLDELIKNYYESLLKQKLVEITQKTQVNTIE